MSQGPKIQVPRQNGSNFVVDELGDCEETYCKRLDEYGAGGRQDSFAHEIDEGTVTGCGWEALVDHEAKLRWEVVEAERSCIGHPRHS
jgi:hypothetical protein